MHRNSRYGSRSGLARRALLAAPFLPLVLRSQPAEVRHFEVMDQSERDADLVKFLANLKAIVEKKDAKALLALMAPTFRVDFARGKGPAAFRARWKPELATSEVWTVLARLLSIGGTFYSKTLYGVPYVYTRWPVDLDPFTNVAVTTASKAAVYAEQSAQSKVVAEVSAEIVATEPPLKPPIRLEKSEWLRVMTPSGAGYIATKDVYDAAGYRAFFEKRNGRWVWISLVCTD